VATMTFGQKTRWA